MRDLTEDRASKPCSPRTFSWSLPSASPSQPPHRGCQAAKERLSAHPGLTGFLRNPSAIEPFVRPKASNSDLELFRSASQQSCTSLCTSDSMPKCRRPAILARNGQQQKMKCVQVHRIRRRLGECAHVATAPGSCILSPQIATTWSLHLHTKP